MAIVKITARRLVIEADNTMREGRVDPLTDCLLVYDAWQKAKPEHFARIAVNIGMRPPEAHVVQAFMELLRDRCERRHPGYLASREQVSA